MRMKLAYKPRKRTNLIGQKFGRLTVIDTAQDRIRTSGTTSGRPSFIIFWKCRCVCGNEIEALGTMLKKAGVRSCGCLVSDLNRKRLTKHGCAKGKPTRLYQIWGSMKSRCENPNHEAYDRYGARGIKVCEEWKTFDGFMRDMGNPPEGMSLDRIDNDGNYEPGNVRWATKSQQARNRGNSIFLKIGDQTKHIVQWATDQGLKISTVRERLRRGWSPSRALQIP